MFLKTKLIVIIFSHPCFSCYSAPECIVTRCTIIQLPYQSDISIYSVTQVFKCSHCSHNFEGKSFFYVCKMFSICCGIYPPNASPEDYNLHIYTITVEPNFTCTEITEISPLLVLTNCAIFSFQTNITKKKYFRVLSTTQKCLEHFSKRPLQQ